MSNTFKWSEEATKAFQRDLMALDAAAMAVLTSEQIAEWNEKFLPKP